MDLRVGLTVRAAHDSVIEADPVELSASRTARSNQVFIFRAAGAQRAGVGGQGPAAYACATLEGRTGEQKVGRGQREDGKKGDDGGGMHIEDT